MLCIYLSFLLPFNERFKKLVYRLIMFLSTEIFSKRRKIYAWFEGKAEFTLMRSPHTCDRTILTQIMVCCSIGYLM